VPLKPDPNLLPVPPRAPRRARQRSWPTSSRSNTGTNGDQRPRLRSRSSTSTRSRRATATAGRAAWTCPTWRRSCTTSAGNACSSALLPVGPPHPHVEAPLPARPRPCGRAASTSSTVKDDPVQPQADQGDRSRGASSPQPATAAPHTVHCGFPTGSTSPRWATPPATGPGRCAAARTTERLQPARALGDRARARQQPGLRRVVEHRPTGHPC